MNTSLKFVFLCLFVFLGINISGICNAQGGLGAPPPTFTDQRTTPIGHDLLRAASLDGSDTFTVDLMINNTDTETGGKLTPAFQVTEIWSGTGSSSTAQTGIDTLPRLNAHYNSGVGFYQYQFHDTRTSTNTTYDINASVYSYSLPNG